MKTLNFSIIILLILIGFGLAQSDDIRITNNGEDQNISTIAIDPLNPDKLMICWQDFQSGYWSEPGYGFSTDGGNNWTTGILPDHNGYDYGYHPACAFDRSNHAFYGYVASPAAQTSGPVYVSETPNYGGSWQHHVRASNLGANDNALPHIAIDNTTGTYSERIYASWTADPNTSNPKILFAYSPDYGSTFSTPIELASATSDPDTDAYFFPDTVQPTTPGGYLVTGSMPAIGPNGEVYVVWEDLDLGSTGSFKIRKSTDGGANFASAVTVVSFNQLYNNWGTIGIFNFPSLAVDPSNGYVYLAYADNVSNKPRIKFVRSTNGGTNWSSPSIIGNLGEQGEAIPAIACDSYGKVAVSYIHRHNDSNIDCYVVESYDRGASFRSPVKVSDVSSNPAYATWYTSHYRTMALDNAGNDYVVWTDYRNGSASSHNSDIYFDKVNTPPAAPQNLSRRIVNSPTNNPRIDWDANEEADLDEYEVWKKKGNGSWDVLATTSYTYYIDTEETGVGLLPVVNDIAILYRVEAVDLAGNHSDPSETVTFHMSGGNQEKVVADPSSRDVLPGQFILYQNHPNPFNPNTTIQFALPEAQEVEIAVYNLTGQKIATLAAGVLEEGFHQVEWGGKDGQGNAVSSGIYIYQLKTGNQRMVKKMVLAK